MGALVAAGCPPTPPKGGVFRSVSDTTSTGDLSVGDVSASDATGSRLDEAPLERRQLFYGCSRVAAKGIIFDGFRRISCATGSYFAASPLRIWHDCFPTRQMS